MSSSTAWVAANRERNRATRRAWRAANRESVNATKRAWASAHIASVKNTNVKTYQKHKEVRAYEKTERGIAKRRARYAANPGPSRAKASEYQKTHPILVREIKKRSKHKRRAQKAGGGGCHTAAQRRAKWALHGRRCFYCGTAGKLTIDHDVPIARGGHDGIGNLLPACGSCNSRKHTKTAAEYLAVVG